MASPYWTLVEIVYVTDIVIFAYLAQHFWRAYRRSAGETRRVVATMAILTTVLFLQETYFGLNTASDPNKLATLFPDAFSVINSVWIYAKVILTFAGLLILYTLRSVRK